nr:zinc finger protein OZF-like [Leptinotarsa decemlineata]
MDESQFFPFTHNILQNDIAEHIQIKTENSCDHIDKAKLNCAVNVKCDLVKAEPEELFVCELCRKHFDTETELSNHDLIECQRNVNIEENQESSIPELKDKITESKVLNIKCEPGFEQELSYSTTIKTEESYEENVPEEYLTVEVKEENEFKEQMQASSKESKNRPRIPCDLCTKTFSIAKTLRNHVAVVHNNERPFQCQVCLKSFGRKALLKEHENYHTGEKLFECKTCSKTFSKNSVLKVHLETHVKRFQCKYCSETFTCKTHLVKHERSHSDKPFQCEMCPKAFALKVYLVEHIRIHNGEKPYACRICFKCFTRNSHCRRHERTHSGEKPFQCKLCPKAFSQNAHLVDHERTHSGDKPYRCSFCDKSFSQKSYRNIHERTHNGITPFKCHVCNKAFTQSHRLAKHEKIHKKEEQLLSLPEEGKRVE